MTDIILAGSGGCMRELVWQMQEQNKQGVQWRIRGYVDRERPLDGIGVMVGGQRISYLGDDDYLLRAAELINVAVCVGTSKLRERIVQKLIVNPSIQFPNMILGETKICGDVEMGKGCIISMDARISTNVHIGDFVFLNTGSMVCHDGCLGDFVTLSPDVKLAGNVTVGSCSELGMGTKVIQGIKIGRQVITGAGSVVVRDLPDVCTAVGVPARARMPKKTQAYRNCEGTGQLPILK